MPEISLFLGFGLQYITMTIIRRIYMQNITATRQLLIYRKPVLLAAICRGDN